MKSGKYIGITFLIAVTLIISCGDQKQQSSTPAKKHKLVGDYPENLSETLDEIISLSKISHDGYGILLILDQAISQRQADSLKWYFQKKDINAIHTFNVSVNDTINPVLQSAVKNSRFVWLFSKGGTAAEKEKILSSLDKLAPESLIVFGNE